MRRRAALYAGVSLLTASAIVVEVALTRLYSVMFGHHLAFFAISLSLFGIGLGGVLLYLFPQIARPPRLYSRLATLSGLSATSSVVALIFVLTRDSVESLDGSTLLGMAGLYLVCAAPFTFIGIALAAAVRHSAADVARVYLFDLSGAAAGGVLAIVALRFGAPRAMLVTAIAMALAGICFAVGARRGREPEGDEASAERPAHAGLVAAFALSSVVLLLGDLGKDPWLEMPSLEHVDMKKVQFKKWNELAFVTVDRPVRGMAWMRLDGSSSTAILDEKTRPPRHPDEMAYVLDRAPAPVAVIGAGGGRDVRAALEAGQTEVYAVEINRVVVDDVMRGRFAAFSGGLYARPEVHVVIADGRSFARRTERKFGAIVLSLVDTNAASAAGALALAENGLYTEEAFADFIERLEDDGTFVVNRWDEEFDRLLAVAVAGLERVGVESPKDHLFACSHTRSTALLVKRTPLADGEVRRLRQYCKRKRFDEMFAPDDPKTGVRKVIAAGMLPAGAESDVSAPTDDRPFFFYTVPTRRLPAVLTAFDELSSRHKGLLALLTLLASSTLVALLFLVAPLLARPSGVLRAVDRGPRARALTFFALIGGGFVMVEVGLVSQFTLFLGHPVYALSAVLSALLVSSGVGSLLTARVSDANVQGAAARRAQVLSLVLVGLALGVGPLLEAGVSFPLAGRLGLAFVVLTPLGLLMGALAPLAIRAVASRAEALIPWCWGLGGLASVVATAVGTLLAMQEGYGMLLVVSSLLYFAASLFVPAPHRGAPPAPTAPAISP